MKHDTPPDGIILTVSAGMIGNNGYRHWLKNFLEAMERSETDDDWYYWFRAGGRPKSDKHLRFVYLVIGGKIRFKVIFAGSQAGCQMFFANRSEPMYGKAWILTAGPVVRPPRVFKMKGFQGFRYTEEIF